MKRASLYCLVVFLLGLPAMAGAWEWEAPGGHVKYQYQGASYPEHSLYRTLVGSRSSDQLLDNRWKFSLRENSWDLQVDYQLQAVHGDRQQLAALSGFAADAIPDDDARLFDLTHELSSDDDTTVLHRLDRFNLGFTSGNTVIRFGRQVVSWGNGLMFNPMDFFNPFDPAALDKEYKTGDDMLYSQYLFDSGADVQAVWVIRRDLEDNQVHGEQSSLAAKYHRWLDGAGALLENVELDIVLARHYDDEIIGAGLIKSIGGAVWRGDLLLTNTEADDYWSIVTNVSYSWVWSDTNWSGAVEYFYNGFGMSGDETTLADIQARPHLAGRIMRGELYTTGKHYLAASASVELTPLWLATPAVFANLGDQSALLQLATQYSLAQNWQLTAAVNIPLGSKNTEYGGLKTGIADTTLATDGGLFLQLGFYY